jgi:NAD(P)-dependent dehydrogenase (short-subunit alcohol dehydrogenase family)
MAIPVTGQVAIVTGASQGISAGIGRAWEPRSW